MKKDGTAAGCILCRREYNRDDRRSMKRARRMEALLREGYVLNGRALSAWRRKVYAFFVEAQG